MGHSFQSEDHALASRRAQFRSNLPNELFRAAKRLLQLHLPRSVAALQPGDPHRSPPGPTELSKRQLGTACRLHLAAFRDGAKPSSAAVLGIFSDIFPGTVASSFDTNPPLKNTFVTTGLLAPGVAGSAQSLASSSNAAFVSGFNSGLSRWPRSRRRCPSLVHPPSPVRPIAFNIRRIRNGTWRWSRRSVPKMSPTINYVGNHGSDLAAINPGLNGYCGGACLWPP